MLFSQGFVAFLLERVGGRICNRNGGSGGDGGGEMNKCLVGFLMPLPCFCYTYPSHPSIHVQLSQNKSVDRRGRGFCLSG